MASAAADSQNRFRVFQHTYALCKVWWWWKSCLNEPQQNTVSAFLPTQTRVSDYVEPRAYFGVYLQFSVLKCNTNGKESHFIVHHGQVLFSENLNEPHIAIIVTFQVVSE